MGETISFLQRKGGSDNNDILIGKPGDIELLPLGATGSLDIESGSTKNEGIDVRDAKIMEEKKVAEDEVVAEKKRVVNDDQATDNNNNNDIIIPRRRKRRPKNTLTKPFKARDQQRRRAPSSHSIRSSLGNQARDSTSSGESKENQQNHNGGSSMRYRKNRSMEHMTANRKGDPPEVRFRSESETANNNRENRDNRGNNTGENV